MNKLWEIGNVEIERSVFYDLAAGCITTSCAKQKRMEMLYIIPPREQKQSERCAFLASLHMYYLIHHETR